MMKVLTVRSELNEYWQAHPEAATSAIFSDDDQFAAFDTSKYLIQDSGEAVWSHMVKGFSSDSMSAYLEFWGVMQALIIQQDAICEIHKSLVGSTPSIPTISAWFDLRNLRNRLAGHPASKSVKGGVLRSFMGRDFGDYEEISYEQYDSSTKASTWPGFNLRQMINDYDAQAAALLASALAELKRKCA